MSRVDFLRPTMSKHQVVATEVGKAIMALFPRRHPTCSRCNESPTRHHHLLRSYVQLLKS